MKILLIIALCASCGIQKSRKSKGYDKEVPPEQLQPKRECLGYFVKGDSLLKVMLKIKCPMKKYVSVDNKCFIKSGECIVENGEYSIEWAIGYSNELKSMVKYDCQFKDIGMYWQGRKDLCIDYYYGH